MDLFSEAPKPEGQMRQAAEAGSGSSGPDYGSAISDVLMIAADIAGELLEKAADAVGDVDA